MRRVQRKREDAGVCLMQLGTGGFPLGYPFKKKFYHNRKKIQAVFKLKNAPLCHGREEGGVNISTSDDFLNLLHNNLSPISKEPALSGALRTTCRRWCRPPPCAGTAPGEPAAQCLHDAQRVPPNQHRLFWPSAAFPYHSNRRRLLSRLRRT